MITLTIVSIIVLALTATASAGRSPAEKVARTVTKVWSCQDAIGVPRTKTGNIWAKHSPGYRRYQLRVWKARLEQCRQWNYKAWLPAHWQRVAQCETQTNWRHSNSSYQGAFGFAISSWDAFKLAGYPNEAWQASPWQQYQVALQIYNRFGMSGWGCKG